ncbi:MAG: hypothetical protein HY238_20580 [Acidobacteria bacterium]|nr:hypothetical protein [Acidobacteriota bacterium]
MSRQWAAGCLLALSSAAGVSAAQPAAALAPAPAAHSSHSRWQKRWVASWVALVAVNALDIASSRGHHEANPLFRGPNGRFSPGKAVLLKSAIGGGFFATQLWLLHRHPEREHYKPFTVTNSLAAGGLAGVAIHNYRLPPGTTDLTQRR